MTLREQIDHEKREKAELQSVLEVEVAAHNRLQKAVQEACDLLAERTYGNPARSSGHNARLRLEAALSE